MESLEAVQAEVNIWQRERNQMKVSINWRFTIDDVSIKLKRLYPSIK